ncbi:hypothetical protein QBC37DRAFT_121152 [Rhypophila decipiens]|uniref:Nephrocystin 3-like N-terminal domain-containing protein n=1 Tax=Rhypophila decipiens TaxID=261697 RepID=A0AAN6XTV7_9PEZI|nr:hypothetical protein QBC37DRAFT_121152 [Rhypophila decipiens]
MAIPRPRRLPHQIFDTGLSIIIEPESGNTVADIVFVHGLQGHPYKTWAFTKGTGSSNDKGNSVTDDAAGSPAKHRLKRAGSSSFGDLRRLLPKKAKTAASSTSDDGNCLTDVISRDPDVDEADGSSPRPLASSTGPVYWPRDLLPSQCPWARVLAWGYDTVVTKTFTAPSNKNNVLSHAKDLLFSLGRERPTDRPVVFVAHSLGGIMVKEVLANSAESEDPTLRSIAQNTAAVVFLGTPHRGSQQMANLGETVRKIASSILKMDTNPAALDALGLRTSDLERCQDSFSKLWRTSNFTVKTFQEGLGLTGLNIGLLSNKVVPDYSSSLGDPRERVETLQANHRDMCRFTGAQDPNYRKVAGELRQIYQAVIERTDQNFDELAMSGMLPAFDTESKADVRLNHTNVAEIFKFPKMNRRLGAISEPARSTCQWLFDHPTFATWLRCEGTAQHHGLLWVCGKPGTGKSTLLREVYREILKAVPQTICCVFFFNGKGGRLERTPVGLYRALLYQLACRAADGQSLLAASMAEIQQQRTMEEEPCDSEFLFSETGVKRLLVGAINSLQGQRAVILIDALDECDYDAESSRHVAYFLRELTDSAYASGVCLDICFSSRRFPLVSLRDCPEICVEEFNSGDIALYVDKKISMGGLSRQTNSFRLLRNAILAKASGLFLWVVLVVDTLLKEHDEGASVKHLITRTSEMPAMLGELFTDLLSKNRENVETTVRFFHWAILGSPSLRIREWRHILGFVRCGSFGSLKEWESSRWYPETDEDIEKQIHNISMGLVEVVGARLTRPGLPTEGHLADDGDSIGAGAGSLVAEGENRSVQVVHESVREFFLHQNGFSALRPWLRNPIGMGHLAMIHHCFDYMCLKELDRLIEARAKYMTSANPAEDENSVALHDTARNQPSYSRPPSVASFGSAGSPCYSPAPGRNDHAPPPADEAQVLAKLNNMYKDSDDCEKYRLSLIMGDGGWVAHGSPELKAFRPAERFIQECPLETESTSSNKALSTTFSVVLEADLPLLDYSTRMVITHGLLADLAAENQEGGLAPRLLEDVVLRLRTREIWHRWKLLNEEVPPHCGLLEYLAEKKLKSWVSILQIELSASSDNPHSAASRRVVHGRLGNQDATYTALGQRDVLTASQPVREPPLHRLIKEQNIGGTELYLNSLEVPPLKNKRRRDLISVNAVNSLGQTPLHLAVNMNVIGCYQDLQLDKRLLRLGADVNARDISGHRPLDMACSVKEPAISLIRLLVKNGADLGSPGSDMMTPLQQICVGSAIGIADIAEVLLQAGASPNAEGTSGCKPLSICCEAGTLNRQLIAILIKYGASVDAQDGFGQTALHRACNRQEPDFGLVNMLISHARAACAHDIQGRSALHMLCLRGHQNAGAVGRLLMAADWSMINARDNQGSTPLLLAVRRSHPNLDLVNALITHGAYIGAMDTDGKTPISVALARLDGNKGREDVEMAESVLKAAYRQGHSAPELDLLRDRLDRGKHA